MQKSESTSKASTQRRRQHARWSLATRASLIVLAQQPPSCVRPEDICQVSCRDLSSTGVGLQATRPLSHGTHVVLLLQRVEGDRASTLPATVQRCEQRRPGLYDIGVVLHEPIDVRDYLRADHFSNIFTHEHVEPHAVFGTVLLVAGTKLDEGLVRAALARTRAVLHVVETRSQLATLAPKTDLAIIAADAPLAPAGDVLVDLYCSAFVGRSLLIAPDAKDATRRMVGKLPFAAVVVRPMSREVVLSAIAQAMGLRRVDAVCLHSAA